MKIQTHELSKYLRIGCVVKVDDGQYTVTKLGNNFFIDGIGQTHLFNDITKIISYQVPMDIEINKDYIGGYVYLKENANHLSSWRPNQWAKIINLSKYKYNIDIRYIIDNYATAINKPQIQYFNPFCADVGIEVEPTIGAIDDVSTVPYVKYDNKVPVLDIAKLLNPINLRLNQNA